MDQTSETALQPTSSAAPFRRRSVNGESLCFPALSAQAAAINRAKSCLSRVASFSAALRHSESKDRPNVRRTALTGDTRSIERSDSRTSPSGSNHQRAKSSSYRIRSTNRPVLVTQTVHSAGPCPSSAALNTSTIWLVGGASAEDGPADRHEEPTEPRAQNSSLPVYRSSSRSALITTSRSGRSISLRSTLASGTE